MFKRLLPTIVAMLAGLFVLLGSLLPIEIFTSLRIVLVSWAAVLGAFALLLGFFSILQVHINRIMHSSLKNKITSLLVMVAALVAFVLVVWRGPYDAWSRYLLKYVLIPGESALLALTAVTLTLAGMRIFRTRRDIGSVIFILVTLLILMTTVHYTYPPMLQSIIASIVEFTHMIANSGMRGLVIGVALGTILTGLRVLLGMDRPYSDE